MLGFSCSKINLGLYITAKRSDGYHDIETLFYPLAWRDAIEFVPAKEPNFQNFGIRVPGDASLNLILKAYELLKQTYTALPSLSVALLKAVPMGAGLGGGSGNAVGMLKMLNSFFGLNITRHELLAYALQLGSDCPFFVDAVPALGKGRGELLQSVMMDLSGFEILVIHPGIHVSTAQAFSMITPRIPPLSIESIIAKPVSEWKEFLKNDFEEVVFDLHPGIALIKEHMYNEGAVYSAMSGSGSAVYGLFQKDRVTEENFRAAFPSYTIFRCDA